MGDTRPIPEVLNRFASRGERIFHDCCVTPNASHTGTAELDANYKPEQLRRMVLYHYDSEHAGRRMEQRGYRVAHRGERFLLKDVPDEKLAVPVEQIASDPGAAWQTELVSIQKFSSLSPDGGDG